MVSYAWGNMQNGSTGLEALCVAVRGIKLFPDAARAAEAMAVAFEKRFGKRLQFTEGFRPIGRPGDWERGNSNTQWYYYERWLSNKARYPNGAYPSSSIHGWGKAIDVNLTGMNAEQIEWLHTVARTFGFNWDTTGRLIDEPWHLDFNLPVTAGTTPIEEKDWFDMATEDDLRSAVKTEITEYFANGEGRDRIGQAILEHLESPDGARQFHDATKAVVAEYFNGDPGNEGQDRIAQGVLKNDQSTEGKAALKSALS